MDTIISDLTKIIEKSCTIKRFLLQEHVLSTVVHIGEMMVDALRHGRKLLIAGNGGSAADAQHFAAELVGRFMQERKGLPAIALTTNSSILTAIGNDFSFDDVFVRQLEAYGNANDVFVGITTSGQSHNIVKALAYARKNKMVTVGILGKDGGVARALCDFSLIVPSQHTQHIQEAHVLIIHLLSFLIDKGVVIT